MGRTSMRALVAAAAMTALAACDGGTGADGGRVAVRFGLASGAGASLQAADGPAYQANGEELVITGANGTLRIGDLRLVVAEFELDGDDDVNRCADADSVGDDDGDDCDDFNAGPMFVDLPLAAGGTQVSTGEVRPGTYREIEFEVEDLDDDEENPAERQRIEALLGQIRQQFPDWPRRASMLVSGSFTPTGGAAQPFRVFLEAEIEIETALNPPLVVAESGGTRTVEVLLDPAAVFRQGANVINPATHSGELELELETGFRGRGSGD
ncbi:MAG TPA: hypothetical protein VFQ45_04615 [Longimicrobium sp.]|nr:hypothetical protein [Longimicrobium sp.]